MTVLRLPPVNRPFVEALERVSGTSGTWSVIGGFAVWCHLGETHRPTLDIDAAATTAAHRTLVALADGRGLGGIDLEVIEVIDPSHADVSDEQQRLFLLGHWAAATLTLDVGVECADLGVVVSVARRLPLVACKLHAWLDRRGPRADKRGSDGLDVIRLLQHADWDDMAADARAVAGLGEVVRWAAEVVLVEQAARVSRLVRVHTDAAPILPAEIEALGHALVDIAG